jgi:glycogen operon protein
LAASSDLFHHSQRLPSASVNFITAHDGFSLRDVVSYHRKHNLANGEDNRDGRDNELSANFGVEGPTDDAAVNEVRGRVQRAMMATLLLAQGTPMLAAGDEIGKSQRGNNNAYCQDAPLSWLDWAHADTAMLALVCQCLALRAAHECLRHDQWFADHGDEALFPKVRWMGLDGQPLQAPDWQDTQNRSLVCMFSAPQSPTLLTVFHPHDVAAALALQGAWRVVLDSTVADAGQAQRATVVQAVFEVPSRAVVVLQSVA